MIYLASPYNHPDPMVMQIRFEMTAIVTAALIREGRCIYSPIVHNHYLASNFNLPRDFTFWMNLDLPILERCDKLLVLMLSGWDTSAGIQAETQHALNKDITIEHLDPAKWL